ncbi:MAG TPA: YdcF family protein [Anaeromyxobacteraceae bacterium]|nr:YdcF family protein [Anaeromyxobacteraceae bacterium]
MFLALSKVLDVALAPLSWALALLAISLLLRRRLRRPWLPAAAAAGILLLFSAEPVANRLARLAERSAPRTFRADVVYDAVVVLGGAVDDAASRSSGEVELTEGADRIVRGFELVRAGNAAHVLYSCGSVAPGPGDVPEAERVAALYRRWGLPEERIVAEVHSRNTRENAVESARIVRERGWRTLLLVTSAAHMDRALGCFRAVGLSPDALAVDHHAGDGRGLSWLPRASALALSTSMLREWFGRIVYRIAGWSAG